MNTEMLRLQNSASDSGRTSSVVHTGRFPGFDRDAAAKMPSVDFNPMAVCLSDQISAKQNNLARSYAKYAGVDENEVSEMLFGCELGELSKAGASRLIDYLVTTSAAFEARLQTRLAG